jgi:hypothetical protein
VLQLTLHPTGYDWRFVPEAGKSFTDVGSAACTEAGYARPKSAPNFDVSLVPAFDACQSPDAAHGAPLASPSCDPPRTSSSRLTVGTPDSNRESPNFVGSLTLGARGESPIDETNGDQADVAISTELTDVRNAGALSDYTGELQGKLTLRITDRGNGPAQDESATVTEWPVSFAIPCAATPDDAGEGSRCAIATTVDSLIGGAVQERRRSVWQVVEAKVLDGGADGSAATADNADFARPGLFTP